MTRKEEDNRGAFCKDKDGNEIYWGECMLCGERTHHKVKDNVMHRNMIPGEIYYYMHETCSNKMRKYFS